MNLTIKRISDSDFRKLGIKNLFEDESKSRAFGVFGNGIRQYKIAWQSDQIDPIIKQINDDICLVGIDQIFIVFNLLTGKIERKISLYYLLCDVKIYNDVIYVITELEIIAISVASLEIRQTYALPNYFENIKFGNDFITATCIDSEIVILKYPQ